MLLDGVTKVADSRLNVVGVAVDWGFRVLAVKVDIMIKERKGIDEVSSY